MGTTVVLNDIKSSSQETSSPFYISISINLVSYNDALGVIVTSTPNRDVLTSDGQRCQAESISMMQMEFDTRFLRWNLHNWLAMVASELDEKLIELE